MALGPMGVRRVGAGFASQMHSLAFASSSFFLVLS